MNAFNVELIKMQKQFYQEVKLHPRKPLIIAEGGKEELKFFEMMFKYQLSDEATTRDMFLFQQQPFEDANTYGESLITEWTMAYKGLQEELKDIQAWDYEKYIISKKLKSYQTDAYRAFYALELLYTIIPRQVEQYVFIQLATTEIQDNAQLQLWLKEWCEVAKERENFKLVVTDHPVAKMVKDTPLSHRYELYVDISKLMEAGASQGDGTKKSGLTKEFNQCIVKSNSYLDNNDYKQAILCVERALSIAKKINSNELVLMALVLLAQIYVGMKKIEEADKCFKEAYGLELEPFKRCQLGLFYGGFLYSQSEASKGKKVFEEVITLAQQHNLYALLIELHHQMAHLTKSFFSSSNYVYHLEQAMSYSRLLPQEEIKGSTVLYVASLLIREYGKGSDKAKAIDKEMSEAVSVDWQEGIIAPPKKK